MSQNLGLSDISPRKDGFSKGVDPREDAVSFLVYLVLGCASCLDVLLIWLTGKGNLSNNGVFLVIHHNVFIFR